MRENAANEEARRSAPNAGAPNETARRRKISVHVPAFNQEPFLGQCLDSILNAGFDDMEILVFNDASTDGTLAIAKSYASRDGRIRILDAPVNGGCTKALQTMLENARAEYVVTLDADDVLLPGNLARQASLLDASPSCSAVYGRMLRVDAALKPLGSTMGQPFSRFLLAAWNQIGHCGTMFRRSAALEAGGYFNPYNDSEFFCEDYFLWQRMAEKGDFAYEDVAVCLYRQHPGQMTKVKSERFKDSCDKMRRHCLERNADLVKELFSGRSKMEAKASDLKRLVLLLGMLFHDGGPRDKRKAGLLQLAFSIDRSDYGIILERALLLADGGAIDEGLSSCDPLLSLGVDKEIRMKASLVKADLLARKGLVAEASEFRRQANELLEECCRTN